GGGSSRSHESHERHEETRSLLSTLFREASCSSCLRDERTLARSMPPETLEFEESIAVILKEIEALALLPATEARDRQMESHRGRLESARAQVYSSLTSGQRS